MIFENRQKAAGELTKKLRRFKSKKLQVLAISRGGVLMGKEIADSLEAPLDVLVVHPLGISRDVESQIGAVAEGEIRVIDEFLMEVGNVPWEMIEQAAYEEEIGVKSEIDRLRGGRPLDVMDKSVIIVTDGIVSEAVTLAAVEAIKRLGAKKVILASPVCALSIYQDLLGEVEETVFLATPYDIGEVSFWYKKFENISESEVQLALRSTKDIKLRTE